MSDQEQAVLTFLTQRGPVTIKRISKVLGLSKKCVRGVLWHSKNTKRVDQAPMCTRKRPMWSYSDVPIRPQVVKRVKTSSDASYPVYASEKT